MIMWEQVDKTGERLTYSWMWEAPYNYKYKAEQEGWKWVRGKPRGCYVTNSKEVAERTRLFYGCKIRSNGTHEVHKALAVLATP